MKKNDHCSDCRSQCRSGARRAAAITRPEPETESAVWSGPETGTGQTGSPAERSAHETGSPAERSAHETGSSAAETGASSINRRRSLRPRRRNRRRAPGGNSGNLNFRSVFSKGSIVLNPTENRLFYWNRIQERARGQEDNVRKKSPGISPS